MKESFLKICDHNGLASFFGMSYSQLSSLIYSSSAGKRYKKFLIPKKTGGDREIKSPNTKLKELQTKLKNILYEFYPEKVQVHGFCKSKSIVTNSQSHLNKTHIFNIDLINFFGTIHFGRVRNLFLSKPFDFPMNVATVLAQICCDENSLPQGAPTSPIISNMITLKMDAQLLQLAKNCNCTYTRYVDDISFSFTCQKRRLPSKILNLSNSLPIPSDLLTQIINENGFKINPNKVRLTSQFDRMEVTGLTVNEFVNVKRNYIRRIRSTLYAWKTFGYDRAESDHNDMYRFSNEVKNFKVSLKYFVKGKIAFLKSVLGERNSIYRSLVKSFNALVDDDFKFKLLEDGISAIPLHESLWVIEVFYEDETTKEKHVFQGSGFDLEGFGLITCAHVVADEQGEIYKEIIAYRAQKYEIKYEVSVKNVDLGRDIALCSIIDKPENPTSFYPLKLSTLQTFPKMPLSVYGFPSHHFTKPYHVADTKVTQKAYKRGFIYRFEIDHPLRQGISGGPLVDEVGNVIGVAIQGQSGNSGANLILSSNEIGKAFPTV